MTKSKYRFLLRPLADPKTPVRTEELITELEAGPFTPLEASAFGQMETVRKAMATGEIWVCNYTSITDEPVKRRPVWLIVAICSVIVGFILGDLLTRFFR